MFVLTSVMPNIVQAQYYGCTSNYQERCLGNNLYWYDSCGNQQNIAQYCSNGCYNNSCQNTYNDYGNCAYHAYKLCVGNSIYWYDSCGNQQDLYYNCSNGQTCQYGQCIALQPRSNYVAHYRTSCYGISLYWYDSLGVFSGLYKNCADNNSCTLDACSSNKCSNTIKCDGSTCATNSTDYNSYCATMPAADQNNCGNGLCELSLEETTANCPDDCKINTANGLSISFSFFAKQNSNSDQWQKTTQVDSNSQVYFMISATNSSTTQINNVDVSANIPSEISSLGNLQLNGVPVSGDIVSGINIGSLAPTSTKSITFEGKTQTISSSSTKQATATSNISGDPKGALQSDSVSIILNPIQATAAVSATPTTSGFWEFLKHWYLWILGALVLIFLFFVVFKRISSED